MEKGNRIELTKQFLVRELEQSEFFKEYPRKMMYRMEHSYRVANIGRLIAEKEGMDAEAMTIGCLLHDVSYRMKFKEGDWLNHGRYSAQIARPFLEELGMNPEQIEDICYGIAIHVDDKADFEGKRTSFALTIGDADNIDRFDAYRIYETLQWDKYDELSKEEKTEYVEKKLCRLKQLKETELATPTGQLLWTEKINFQTEFYLRLRHQIEISEL